jgi:anti-anti-sigma factor
MALAVAPTLSEVAVRLAPTATVLRGDGHTLVSLEGEYDIASLFSLAESLAMAIALDDSDLVIDLSKVEFMGAETLGVLIRARVFLHAQSRSLILHTPSPSARRVLELCGLDDLPRRLELVAPASPRAEA